MTGPKSQPRKLNELENEAANDATAMTDEALALVSGGAPGSLEEYLTKSLENVLVPSH